MRLVLSPRQEDLLEYGSMPHEHDSRAANYRVRFAIGEYFSSIVWKHFKIDREKRSMDWLTVVDPYGKRSDEIFRLPNNTFDNWWSSSLPNYSSPVSLRNRPKLAHRVYTTVVQLEIDRWALLWWDLTFTFRNTRNVLRRSNRCFIRWPLNGDICPDDHWSVPSYIGCACQTGTFQGLTKTSIDH